MNENTHSVKLILFIFLFQIYADCLCKKCRIVKQKHWITCKKTKKIFLIDLVLESCRLMSPILVCIFFCDTRKKGPEAEDAAKYMHKIQEICNTGMGFYPQMAVLCVYGPIDHARLYSTTVNVQAAKLALPT